MILCGDALKQLQYLSPGSINTCVTSPPYFNLRDYGVSGQIGSESTPEAYIVRLAQVFREVWRVLRDDGTLWIVIGDSYTGSGKGGQSAKMKGENYRPQYGGKYCGHKPKDLIGIPWLLAFALRSDGWYWRDTIIWHKPNCMPESVKDRCTQSHEYILFFSKSRNYYYDHESIKETAVNGDPNMPRGSKGAKTLNGGRRNKNITDTPLLLRNRRDVWSVSTKPYRGAHFATFPIDLIEPCILAGCPEGGTVLDPFAGSGTTGVAALNLGREFVGVELNHEYVELANKRLEKFEVMI